MKIKKILAAAITSFILASSMSAESITITGIVDPSTYQARTVEMYIEGTVDLSAYTLQRSTNGGNNFSSNITLSGTYTDSFVYVSNSSTFSTVFGSSGDFANLITNGNITPTGNDAFRLVDEATKTTVIDIIGDPTNSSNIFQDGWMYKNDGVGNIVSYDSSSFTFSGNNALDNLSNAETLAAVPFGTYVVPEPNTYALLAGVFALASVMLRRRSVK